MDIFGVGGNELLIIFVLAVVILGPERLVRSVRQMGRHVRNIKAYFRSLTDELKAEIDLMDELKDLNEVKRDLLK